MHASIQIWYHPLYLQSDPMRLSLVVLVEIETWNQLSIGVCLWWKASCSRIRIGNLTKERRNTLSLLLYLCDPLGPCKTPRRNLTLLFSCFLEAKKPPFDLRHVSIILCKTVGTILSCPATTKSYGIQDQD